MATCSCESGVGLATLPEHNGQYGAGPTRLSITCGVSLPEAKKIHDAYWEKNKSIKQAAEDQVVHTYRDQMWLQNPINGFWYSLRTKKDIFSTLVQGSASYCFDVWIQMVLHERPQITATFHDEGVWSIRKGAEDKMETLLRRAIDDTNEFLGLNRDLDIEIQFGRTYADIH